jgi:hypothetical protein
VVNNIKKRDKPSTPKWKGIPESPNQCKLWVNWKRVSKLSKAAHKKREQVKTTELKHTPMRVLSTGRLNKTRTDPKMGERAKKSTTKKIPTFDEPFYFDTR